MSLAQLTRWWDSAWTRYGQRNSGFRGRTKRRTSFRPQLLALEDRCLLTTVTNLMDSGAGSLRQAIADTGTTGTVDFADGLHGTITLTSAPLTVNKVLTIAGPGASVITVSGNNARKAFIIPAGFTVDISGLTIANGYDPGNDNGGGIANAGTLTITGCTFRNNRAAGAKWGGGISNTLNLRVVSSTFSGNSADQGGGIANFSNLRVDNSIFSGNSVNHNGGGIFNFNSGSVTANSSTFSGNSAGDAGGGIGNFVSGTLTVSSSTLSGNSARFGGGIYNTSNGRLLMVTDSTFRDNRATTGSGGGIATDASSNLTNDIEGSTFSGNSAGNSGGGIFNNGGSNVTINRSTFTLNAATNGAGISHTGTGVLTLTSSTLSGNIASNQAGGIFHSGSGRMMTRNTIVAGNRAFMSSVDVNGGLGSQGYNLIGNGTGGSNYADSDLVGTADMPIDPLLSPLDDYGGSTTTMALYPGSPALNAGDPAELGNPDQRSVVRSGGVNIGAYQASATAFDLAAPDTTVAGAPFDVTVTAVDPFGQVAIGYTGTVTFSSADPYGATLPADYTFTTDDQGTVTFAGGAALYTAGAWDVTATDPDSGITGSATVTVVAAAPDHFAVSTDAANPDVAGTPFDFTVTVHDAYGNTVTGYTGTATFSSADPHGAALPANYTFRASDQGMVTFAGAILYTAGTWDVTATDTSSGITGSAFVNVQAAPAVAFQVIAPASAASGTPFDVTLIAVDRYGNTDTNYQGTATWTSTDHNPGVRLPAAYTFQPSDAGQVTFSGGVTLITVGDQVITATNTTSGISGGATVTVSSPGLGLPESGRRAREDLRATMLEPMTRYEPLTAAVVPPLLGFATSRGGRLESATVQGDLSLGSGFVPQRGDSFLILPAGAVDGLFATGDLDWALRRGRDDSADWTGAN